MLDHIKDKWFLENNSFLFMYVYFTGSTRTMNTYVKNIEIFPKGVMKSNRHTRILSFNNKSRGVRKEHLVLVEKKTTQDMLMYTRPCVCGSLNHFLPKHSNCPLNPKYFDAIEYFLD